MTKICVLFIVLLAITTQCADNQKQESSTLILNEKDKIERIFKALLNVQRSDEKEFKRLITKYPSLVNAHYGSLGYTPLLQLLVSGSNSGEFDVNTIRFLLEQDADVECMDKYEFWTPLTFISSHSQKPAALTVAKLLIQHGADVNAHPENEQFRPLWSAAQNSEDNTDMVKLLLDNGADKTHMDTADKTYMDTKGKTAAENAREQGKIVVADFIENYQKVGSGIKSAK